MSIEAEFLKSINYFAGLSPQELDAVRQRALEKKVDRGEIILYDGEPAQSLFIVVSGAVKVFKTSVDGKEQILTIARPGESFNDVPVFDHGANPANAQAMVQVVLCEINRDDFRTFLKNHPQIADNTNRVLAGKVRQLIGLVEDLSFKHVIGRLAKILLTAGDGASPGPRLTQQDMAAIAGTAREVIGRSLKTLEDEGVIKLVRHRIVVTNKDVLKRRAESTV